MLETTTGAWTSSPLRFILTPTARPVWSRMMDSTGARTYAPPPADSIVCTRDATSEAAPPKG
eukprot:scaffold134061_cov35-Tisochrysis_lutea.AAC.3